jgi:hypothetical protein
MATVKPMAQNPVTLQAVFDDVANTITLSGAAAPPPGPPELTGSPGTWFPQTGTGFSVSFPVQKKNVTGNPTAIYIVPNSEPVERRLVEYVNGAWQLPGTIVQG